MNILITGGAGFIGSNLALKLKAKGHSVRILDNLSTQIHGENPDLNSQLYNSIKGKFEFIKGDVTNYDDMYSALDKQDVVIHLAAETGTGQSMYQIKKYVDTNIGGTALLLDILSEKKHRIKKIIVASSRSIYGEGKYLSEELGIVYPPCRSSTDMDKGNFDLNLVNGNPLKVLSTDEESKIHPSSLYGITKQNQEQMVMTISPTLGISPVAFRYQNVYGPGQSLKNPYTGILSIFSTLIKNGKSLNIFEDGQESRDFVYIDDVVDATILGVEMEEANGEVFNVGTGNPTTVLRVSECLISCYGINVPVNISGNYRLGDIRHNFADLSKIKSVLGFSPKITFEEGIKLFCNWVNEQVIEKDNYDKSIEELKTKGLYK